MSGHSKWANTKHRKAIQEEKRGKIFTKIIRELVTASRLGGGNPSVNPRLRAAIYKALSNNMTRDTVNRAVTRGVGNNEYNNMETLLYEGYGPGGIAIMVKCLSDNRNRTVSEVRNAFTKIGGNLCADGSVSYLFRKNGVISYAPGFDETKIIDCALAIGASDFELYEDGSIDVLTTQETFDMVKDALDLEGFIIQKAEIAFKPSVKVHLESETQLKLLRFIDILESSDDVQDVYHNGVIYDKEAVLPSL